MRAGMPGRGTRGEVAHQAKWLPVVFQVLSVGEGEAASLSLCLSRGGMEAVSVCVCVCRREGCLDVLKGRTVLSPSKSPFRRCSRCRIETERRDELTATPFKFKKLMWFGSSVLLLLHLFLWAMQSSCAGQCVSADMQMLS